MGYTAVEDIINICSCLAWLGRFALVATNGIMLWDRFPFFLARQYLRAPPPPASASGSAPSVVRGTLHHPPRNTCTTFSFDTIEQSHPRVFSFVRGTTTWRGSNSRRIFGSSELTEWSSSG